MISMAILIIPPPILNIIIVVITIALMMMPLSRKKLYRIIPAGSLNLLLRCCLWLYCIYFAIPKSGSSVLVALATDKRNDFICTSFWLRPCSMLLDEYICLSTSLQTTPPPLALQANAKAQRRTWWRRTGSGTPWWAASAFRRKQSQDLLLIVSPFFDLDFSNKKKCP